MATKKTLNLVQGKTFTDVVRWMEKPLVFKAISGISFASGAPRLNVLGHGIAEKWPVAITRVIGSAGINAANTPPRDSDYVEATRIDVSTLELNGVSPIGSNGREWSAYESGGFIQYYTPIDLASVDLRFVFRRSLTDRLQLRCATGGTSGAVKPTAPGADNSVVWEETTLPATKPWEPASSYTTGDVIDAKALLWLSSASGEVVADNANKKITTTITPQVTAALAKQSGFYELEAQDAGGAVRLVDSGTFTVSIEATP